MDLHDFLRSRRSIRRFKQDPIPKPLVERLLSTAVHAPSAHNRQPWRFCVVQTEAAKATLADAMTNEFRRDLLADNMASADVEARVARSRVRIAFAPLVVVVCLDMSEMDVYPDPRRREAERMMATQSAAAAALQLLLAAHAEGLAGVWTCGPLFAPQAVRSALDLDPVWEPQALLLIGVPDQSPHVKDLKALDEIVRWM
jgi:coenzyme F420-0:L-glutamate ligase/coenzyme F420-1:gamma-L-glutamate ligase